MSSESSAAADVFSEILSLMQAEHIQPQATEESNEESRETGQLDEIQGACTEELADLIEEVEVEKLDVGTSEETSDGNLENQLYENGRITVGESLLLIMAFIVRHKLSMVATNDLISLLELHCPKDNNAVKGLSKFREYFQHLKNPLRKHYACPNPKCQVYISASQPKEGDVCGTCGTPLSEKSFFIEFPIEDQLQTILSRKFHNNPSAWHHVDHDFSPKDFWLSFCFSYYSKQSQVPHGSTDTTQFLCLFW